MARWFDEKIQPALKRIPDWIHPNHLTVFRAVLALPVILLREHGWAATAMLIFSSLFDIMDGPLARARGQTTPNGASLDATCDKVFIHSVMWLGCGDRIELWVKITVSALDALLTAARPLKRYLGATENSNRWGGLKTWAQSFALAFVLTRNETHARIAPYVFGLAIVFACLSIYGHVRDLRHRHT